MGGVYKRDDSNRMFSARRIFEFSRSFIRGWRTIILHYFSILAVRVFARKIFYACLARFFWRVDCLFIRGEIEPKEMRSFV